MHSDMDESDYSSRDELREPGDFMSFDEDEEKRALL